MFHHLVMCYSGGPLTVTDANLCLNRLLPDYFPKIFGRTQDQPLDKAAALKAFNKFTTEVTGILMFHTLEVLITTSVDNKFCHTFSEFCRK